MFKKMRLVILFDMLLNPSFKMTASFANIARTTASTSKGSASTHLTAYSTQLTFLDVFISGIINQNLTLQT